MIALALGLISVARVNTKEYFLLSVLVMVVVTNSLLMSVIFLVLKKIPHPTPVRVHWTERVGTAIGTALTIMGRGHSSTRTAPL